MTEEEQFAESHPGLSLIDAVECLKKNRFEITVGVDCDKVSALISRFKSFEQTGEKE
jgi:hypothetical protein